MKIGHFDNTLPFFCFVIFLMTLALPVNSAAKVIVYASPDGETGGWWEDTPISRANGTLHKLTTKYSKRTEQVEIRLLTLGEKPWIVTDYFGPFIFSSRGPKGQWLIIRGPRRGAQRFTRIVGRSRINPDKPRSLRESVCDPLPTTYRQRLCYNGEVDPKVPRAFGDEQRDILDVIGRSGTQFSRMMNEYRTTSKQEPDYAVLSPAAQKHRINCIKLQNSNYVEFKDLAFRDCWLPSVLATDSKHVNLRGSHIEGSSYAFMVMSTNQRPQKAKYFQVVDNVFIQSPSRYKQPTPGCDIRKNLDCAADIWSEIPWGVMHDRFWEMLNGGLMGAIDIGGEVVFKDNTILHAYNGIRLKVSKCNKNKSKDCSWQERTNTNVVISDNTFEYIRDNPIEPEFYANRWIISRNRIKNSHAWISMDGVRGGNIYIFGNRGWFQNGGDGNASAALPSLNCQDFGWDKSPVFKFGGKKVYEGYYIPKYNPDDPFDAGCFNNSGGRVLKVKAKVKRRLNAIYVFNNSWMLRAPVIAKKQSSTLRHWNNAIYFAGCGSDGDPTCRTIPWGCGPPYEDYYTPDQKSIFAGCFDFAPLRGASPHIFDFDAVSGRMPRILKTLGLETNGVELDGAPMFAGAQSGNFTPVNSNLRNAGCRVKPKGHKLICDDQGPDRPHIGAIQANGELFDFRLP